MPRVSQDHGGRTVSSYTIHHASGGGFYVTAAGRVAIAGDLENCLTYIAQKLTEPQPKKRSAK